MADTLERNAPPPGAATAAGPGGLDLRDLVFGALGAGMVIFAIVLLFVGGERDTGAARTPAPVLTMVQPTSGAEISGPLHVVFDLPGELGRLAGGWGVGDLHIHLDVNGREFMPGPRDIERLPNGMYRWTLSGLAAGEHELRLHWAGPDHRPLAEGASIPTRVRVH